MQGAAPVPVISAEYSTCASLGAPATTRPCAALACKPVVWQTGTWSPQCTEGASQRSLVCRTVGGGLADPAVRFCSFVLSFRV